MMPSTSLAVDGSARTFNCVDVVPVSGAVVDWKMGEVGVPDGDSVTVAGRVEVIMIGCVVGVLSLCNAAIQLERNKQTMKKDDAFSLIDTC